MGSSDLGFFNRVAGHLEIELSVPAQPMSPNLINLQASAGAKVVTLKLVPEIYEQATEDFRALTADELDSVAFRSPEIRLRGESGRVVSHQAPNGAFFTVRELLHVVEETERQTRDDTEWFGGVDVHHIFFEGIHKGTDGTWDIWWGS